MSIKNVLVITRRLPVVGGGEDVVSEVMALDDWVDPDDCGTWIDEKVKQHADDFCEKFVEFRSAVFKGSIHRVRFTN